MEKTWTRLSSHLKQTPKADLVQTKTSGRGLIATEDLERADVILEEVPFVLGPPQSIACHFCANCSQSLNLYALKGKINSSRS